MPVVGMTMPGPASRAALLATTRGVATCCVAKSSQSHKLWMTRRDEVKVLAKPVMFAAALVAIASCAKTSPPPTEPEAGAAIAAATPADVEAVSLAWKNAYNGGDAAS